MSFVASFGYPAPVWNVASPKLFVVDLIAARAAASASSSVRLFLGCVNALSNVSWVTLTSPSSCLVAGGS